MCCCSGPSCGIGNDTLIANDFGCVLTGAAGNDTLIGLNGNDTLVGGSGVDTLTGGAGVDTFVFGAGSSSAASALHDLITDFNASLDKIDLSGWDAVSSTSGIDTFHFLSAMAFAGIAGELNYLFDASRNVTVLQGDTNGDRIADFGIDLAGSIALNQGSLVGIFVGPPVVLESFGATDLTAVGSQYYLYDSNNAGPMLKSGGAAWLAGQSGGWAAIAAEQTASGYEVAFKLAGADQYTVWNTDSNGNCISNLIGLVSGSSSALKSLEPSFQQDINGDGQIGIAAVVLKSFGATDLTAVGSQYYLYDSNNAGPMLKSGGAAWLAGQSGGWAAIAAEQTASGYEVAFKLAGADQYTVWNTDSNGNCISNLIGLVSGSSSALKSLEPSFQQDINGDGHIGNPASPIDPHGAGWLL